MSAQIELLNEETLALSFPYDAERVCSLKLLQNRRWNAAKRRWEVHLSHLADVMKIFGLMPGEVSEEILIVYRKNWIRCRLKVELGLLEGRLAGSGAPLEAIDQATSFFVPGYRFSEKFQAGQWDGKRHLFSPRTHRFPAGLWPRVRKILAAHEVEYELLEQASVRGREGNGLGAGPARKPLRDYQQGALEAALRGRRGIIQMATGGGKTLLAAHLIRRIGQPAFFFVHTLDLLYQNAEVFGEELGVEVGVLGDGQANLRPLTVATVQTVLRAFGAARAGKKPPKTADGEEDEQAREERLTNLDEATCHQVREAVEAVGVVIFDECHHLPADSFYKIAMHTRGAGWRFGLSATPWRDDGHDLLLEAALGEKLSITNLSDLIERRFLVPPRIRMAPAPRPRLKWHGLRYQDCYQQAIVENRERNRAIAAQARCWADEGRSVLILVAHVSHGQRLLELLPEANFVHGSLDSASRQRALKELEQKLRPIMIATTLADEGLDIPSLDAVILGGGGKSQTRAYQRIGRALRAAPGKTEARVLDFLDEAPYLREHSQARIALYRQEPRFFIEGEF